jgi:hypothetical protein
MSTRQYVRSISTATSGAAITIQAKGRLKNIAANVVNAAAGVLEISTNPSSLIATADPGISVMARLTGPIGAIWNSFPCDIPVVPFQLIYLHQTGAANTAEVTLCVQEGS